MRSTTRSAAPPKEWANRPRSNSNLKAAQNSRTAYGDTAKFVGNLVQSNKDLFGSVDEVAQYAELSNKLFRSAGKSSEQVAQMQEARTNPLLAALSIPRR